MAKTKGKSPRKRARKGPRKRARKGPCVASPSGQHEQDMWAAEGLVRDAFMGKPETKKLIAATAKDVARQRTALAKKVGKKTK